MTAHAIAAKPFDPIKYKEMTHDSGRPPQAWNEWGPLLRAWLGPATEIMLDMAKVGPGHGCSTSQPAPATRPCKRPSASARRDTCSRPTSPPTSSTSPRENARTRRSSQHRDQGTGRRESGRAGRQLRRGDLAGRPDLFPGSAKGAGRHEAGAQARRPHRRDRLQHGRQKHVLLHPRLGHPPARQAAAAAARPAGAVQPRGRRRALEETFRKAGFRDVQSQAVPAPVRIKTAAECVRFEKESFGALHQMLAGLDEPVAKQRGRKSRRNSEIRDAERV